ncbi:hypothetical protein IMSAG013_01334 [Clostridiales bacterium]|nr:hypothetical protein IMSAG013_01334 [Clostridiales bacterium]
MEKMVRKAVLEDMDALHSLLLHVADCHSSKQSDLFCSGRGAYTRAELLRFMETGDMQIFVSTNEAGTVTGLIICRIKETTNHKVLRNARALWVEDMSVAPSAQKEGYGKMLLDYAKEYGREQGCVRLELNVWAFNENAHAFYLHEGMQEQRHIMEFDLSGASDKRQVNVYE